uniref:Uncharacterized protein n=1 Tax=Magallana gigas TaxID=29159 RepID=K1R001_MAGGI
MDPEKTRPLVSNLKNQFKQLESLNIDRNRFIDELRKAVPNACLLKDSTTILCMGYGTRVTIKA